MTFYLYYGVESPPIHPLYPRQQPHPLLRGPLSRALQLQQSEPFPNNSAQNDAGVYTAGSSPTDPHHAANPWTVTLCVLFVMLMCWCAKPNVPDARYHKDRSYWMGARIRRINRSLHIRRIVAVDDEGNLQLGEASPTDDKDDDPGYGVDLDEEHDVENDDHNNSGACCSICLETYRVGDKVAWTARRPTANSEEMECLHVFHHQCILSWLENPKNEDCPTCRAKVLLGASATRASPPPSSTRQGRGLPRFNHDQVDIAVGEEEKEEGEDDHEEEYGDDDHSSISNSAFFIMHGLIARARRASYNLIGQSVSIDESTSSNSETPLASLSKPSPFRKAQTFGGGSSGYLWLPRQSSLRRRSRTTSVSEHSLSSCCDSNEADVHFVFLDSTATVTDSLESCIPGPVSLRRVASAGPSTPVRSNNKRNNTETMCGPRGSQDYPLRGSPAQGTSRKGTATTISTDADAMDLPEPSLPDGSSDALLGRSFSLSRSASLKRQQSLTDSLLMNSNSSIREEYENEPVTMIDDGNSVDSQGLLNLVAMRQSVSWARDIYDRDDTDRTDEDEIFHLESAV